MCGSDQQLCADITAFVKAMGDQELSDLWSVYLDADAGTPVEGETMTAFMVYIGRQVLSFLGEDAPPISADLAKDVVKGEPPGALPPMAASLILRPPPPAPVPRWRPAQLATSAMAASKSGTA